MLLFGLKKWEILVALRKESVDRKTKTVALEDPESVALRKESVDRKAGKAPYMENAVVRSLSARRAWIEKLDSTHRRGPFQRRSPQGERG